MGAKPEYIHDELLVLRCKRGDADALEQLVERWQERLWRYARRLLGDDGAAWDAVQETWTVVVSDLVKLGDCRAFGGWIFRVLNNKCMDRLRKRAARRRLSEAAGEKARSESAMADGGLGQFADMNAAIDSLCDQKRVLILLRYRVQFSVREIADILGVAEGTVKSRLHRTLAELRRLMGVDDE